MTCRGSRSSRHPIAARIRDGELLLDELGAISPARDDGVRLTKLGRRLARLPIDPRLARMVIEAERLNCAREVLIIVSALSIQDVRERPDDKREQANEMHNRFKVKGSDLLSLVQLWDYLRERPNGNCRGIGSGGCVATSSSTTCACVSGWICTANSAAPPGSR